MRPSKHPLFQFVLNKPKTCSAIILVTTLFFAFMSTKAQVDTDPENMLPANEGVRMFHHEVKQEFGLYDMVVLGVVNEKHPQGIFNPASLQHIQELTNFVLTLADPDNPAKKVISHEVLAPGTLDNIENAGLGQIRFEWLMRDVPQTQEEADQIREATMSNPLLRGTMVSEDGLALALYIPLSSKDFADQARKELLAKIDGLDNNNGDKYYISGLPVAEDSFGKELLGQMFIAPPMAMLVIFLLMLFFFKKVRLIISPMLVAFVAVLMTMGMLVASGFDFHIMSSMIPIFLMPIAIVDSIHILSEFYDVYQTSQDRRRTIEQVMDHLFQPMLYTSLTSAVGFASLALAPIPPIQVFGVFVAIGIMLAWLLTILFIPAYIMMMKESSLADFGILSERAPDKEESTALMPRMLRSLGVLACSRSKVIVVLTCGALAIAAFGISRIQINDNPLKWFAFDQPIRVADRALNSHFAGTYEAYLVMNAAESSKAELFKEPEMLRYLDDLQASLVAAGLVGKSNGVVDIVKKVHQELFDGDPQKFIVPNSRGAVAECLFAFQGSHRPNDLWHFITPDFQRVNIWLQLKSGDNKDMEQVVAAVDRFLADNPPPVALQAQWAGLTYINVVWQDKMVAGMGKSLLGSFIVVALMMMFLFRSPLWGFLAMVPLSVTIALIYGVVGLIGKDYDMPVAVLSSLALGLAIDFAIHFLERSRKAFTEIQDWQETMERMFEAPARAISRNAIVIAVGFCPLLIATLIPYKTVGVLLASIMTVSALGTMLILPASMTILAPVLFRKNKK